MSRVIKYDTIRDLFKLYEKVKKECDETSEEKRKKWAEIVVVREKILEKKNVLIRLKDDWSFYSGELERFIKTVLTLKNVLEIGEREKLKNDIDKQLTILSLMETRLK